MKHVARAAACFTVLWLLTGCIARGPVLASQTIELTATPFFPQKKYQCGPAAMATVLTASGVNTTPDELRSSLYLPERRGSLQVEMLAAPRHFSRLALTLTRGPESLVRELEAGRPVLVLHNYGLPFWPRWHYAVLVGYDPVRDVFVLRSGRQQRQVMRTRRFMVAWHYAGRWAMVVLRPGETPALDDAPRFLESAAAFEKSAAPTEAAAAFEAAVQRWPQAALAYVGRGTASYRLGRLDAAAADFASALRLDGGLMGARNNLAQVRIEQGCPHRALELLQGVEEQQLAAPVRAAWLDTRQQAQAAAAQRDDAARCLDMP